MKTLGQIGDQIAEEYQCAARVSWKLRAWAALLENQAEYEGFKELHGLGLSLRAYSNRLERLAHALDLLTIELSKQERRSKTPT